MLDNSCFHSLDSNPPVDNATLIGMAAATTPGRFGRSHFVGNTWTKHSRSLLALIGLRILRDFSNALLPRF